MSRICMHILHVRHTTHTLCVSERVRECARAHASEAIHILVAWSISKKPPHSASCLLCRISTQGISLSLSRPRSPSFLRIATKKGLAYCLPSQETFRPSCQCLCVCVVQCVWALQSNLTRRHAIVGSSARHGASIARHVPHAHVLHVHASLIPTAVHHHVRRVARHPRCLLPPCSAGEHSSILEGGVGRGEGNKGRGERPTRATGSGGGQEGGRGGGGAGGRSVRKISCD